MSTAEAAWAALSRAEAMINVRHYAEASTLLAQLLAAEPSGDGWCLMAAARLGEGDHAGALNAANQAIALSPTQGWPHRLASSALWNLQNYPESLRAALEARRLEPGAWQSHVSLAHAAVSAGDLQLAADAANEALRLAPEEPDARYVAGRYRIARTDYQRAEDHLRRVLAADPAHAGALNELGRLALEGHNPVKAVSMFARAAAVAPQSPVYVRNVELAVIRAGALVTYALAIAGGVAVVVCAGLRLSLLLTMVSLAGAWAAVGCLLALAGWRVPAATRQVISRIARRRHVAVPIGIIAAGAAAAVISIPVIIKTLTTTSGPAVPIITPMIIIAGSRTVAMFIWRDRGQTRQ